MTKFRHTRSLADTLTVSRALLGLCLAGLGLVRGGTALPTAVLVVILSWLTDLLDGPLARRDPSPESTWIGSHDAEADLAVSLGVASYLVLSDYLAAWLGATLVLITVGLWILHSHQLAWPFYALPYVVLGVIAFQEIPPFGWLAAGYLLATAAVRWRRLRDEFLPEFFQAAASLRGGKDRPNHGAP